MNNTYIIHSIDKQQKFLLDVFCANCQKENELDFFPFKDSFHFEEKTNYLSIVNDNSINQYQFSCKQMNIDIKQNLFFYYNYYYLKMLYYLCKLNNLSYFFTDINDIKFAHININNSFLLCNNVIRPNNYLNDANNKFKLLSTDILEHGMFFPFFVNKDGQNRYNIMGGIHRFCALKHNSLSKNKNFLFIDTSFYTKLQGKQQLALEKIEQIYNTNFSNPQSIYLLTDNNCYSTKTKNMYLYYIFFKIITEKIVSYLNLYPKAIMPHPVFNNEKAWNTFINSPFQEIAELENFQ